MQSVQIDAAVQQLHSARINVTPLSQLSERPATVEQAYQVQQHLNAKLAQQLGEVAGYKVGCTTSVMQSYLGIDHPCAGIIFNNTIHHMQSGTRAVYASQSLCRPGVECEIGVYLKKDMTDVTGLSIESCASFLASVHASIELVDDRWRDYRQVDTPSLIADNFFGAGCVVGEACQLDIDQLAVVRGTLIVNGAEIGSGVGADILGHPLHALVWLATHLVERGTPLRAGDFVSLGSVVKTHWLTPGDVVTVSFDGLGVCELELSEQGT